MIDPKFNLFLEFSRMISIKYVMSYQFHSEK